MSRAVLQQARQRALQTLTHEYVITPFRQHLCSRYNIDPTHIVCDIEGARRRIEDSILLSPWEAAERRDEIYGETDGETIWIMRGLTLDECVTTLLHEAMHDSVFVMRTTRSGAQKGLSCDVEHEVIYDVLGEVSAE